MYIENHLYTPFLSLMSEIGKYGLEKYGDSSFEKQAQRGDIERVFPRQCSVVIKEHANEHFKLYSDGILHDKFNTLEHQLAAVAFNAMMEYYFLSKGRELRERTLKQITQELSDGYPVCGQQDWDNLLSQQSTE